MRPRLVLHTIALLALCIGVGSAADVTGQWVAQVPGRNGGTQQWTFKLKMNGAKLTGAVVTGQGERPISEGQVTGDGISFVVVQSRGGLETKIFYKGTVSGSVMKLTRTRGGTRGGRVGGGRGGPMEIVAKKVG